MSLGAPMDVMLPMAVCVPKNDLLSGPLGTVISTITGGFGGLLQGVAIVMIIILGLLAIVTILSDKARTYMKGIALVFLIMLAIPVTIAMLMSIGVLFDNIC